MTPKDLIINHQANLKQIIAGQKDAKSIINILESLGHLPADFDGSFLNDLLFHSHTQVRFWAVKTIGKLDLSDFEPVFERFLAVETDTLVRR